MVFRSLTADRSLMDIYTKHIESDDPEEGKKIKHREVIPTSACLNPIQSICLLGLNRERA